MPGVNPWLAGLIAWGCLIFGFMAGLLWAGMFPKCNDDEQPSCCEGQCKRTGVEL